MSCDNLQIFTTSSVDINLTSKLMKLSFDKIRDEENSEYLYFASTGPIGFYVSPPWLNESYILKDGTPWQVAVDIESDWQWTTLRTVIALEFILYVCRLIGGTYLVSDYNRFLVENEKLIFDDKCQDLISKYPFPPELDSFSFVNLPEGPIILKKEDSVNEQNITLIIHIMSPKKSSDFIDIFYGSLTAVKIDDKKEIIAKGNFGPISINLIDLKSFFSTQDYGANYSVSAEISSPEQWRNTIILYSIELCNNYFQWIGGEYIVTLETGESIFLIKENKIIVSEKWREYFSKFPLPTKNYCFEDIPKV